MAFGTTWPPGVAAIEEIVKAAKELPEVGFIMSLKEEWETHAIVKEANLSNVLLKGFVPQKELLNDDNVFAFLSHGGANSIQESMYYGVPLIGLPLADD